MELINLIQKEKRLRILVISASCHPDMGSEPGVGFTWVRALSRFCDLDVICGEKEGNKEAIERELKIDFELSKHARFHFIPRDKFNITDRFLIKLFYPYYYIKYKKWMQEAFKLASTLSKNNDYDLTHQLNMIGYREPGYLWQLNIPFIWGPVGGNGDVPWSFLKKLDLNGILNQTLRSFINSYQIRHNRRVSKAFNQCKGLITANSHNKEIIKKIHKVDSSILLISPTIYPHELSNIKQPQSAFKFVFSGRLISRKNLPTVLYALSKIKFSNWTLDILGDGPLKNSWEKLANKLDINSKINWHGNLEKGKAIKIMSLCDILLFPSLMEGAPGVVSEALSLGLPVVCFNKDGQRDMVNNNSGILIPVETPELAIENFTLAINKLTHNPDKVTSLSKGALSRAKEFTVEKQVQIMLNTYKKALL
jgi:glycosyltransferase involved in cell wall biosynthesis